MCHKDEIFLLINGDGIEVPETFHRLLKAYKAKYNISKIQLYVNTKFLDYNFVLLKKHHKDINIIIHNNTEVLNNSAFYRDYFNFSFIKKVDMIFLGFQTDEIEIIKNVVQTRHEEVQYKAKKLYSDINDKYKISIKYNFILSILLCLFSIIITLLILK